MSKVFDIYVENREKQRGSPTQMQGQKTSACRRGRGIGSLCSVVAGHLTTWLGETNVCVRSGCRTRAEREGDGDCLSCSGAPRVKHEGRLREPGSSRCIWI